MADAGPVEIGAGDREHRGRGVDADGTAVERRKQLEQPPGAGAEIEQGFERPRAERLTASPPRRCRRRHAARGSCPSRRHWRRNSGAPLGLLLLDLREPLAVARQDRVAAVGERAEVAGQPPARPILGKPVEHPGALGIAVDQPGLGQELAVAGDARLRLAEDGGEVLDRQLGLAEQRQHAEARRLARRLQGADQGIERQWRRHVHSGDLLSNNI